MKINRAAVAAAMDRTGMTNRAIARECGVAETTAGNWHTGWRSPRPEHARTIARLAGVELSSLYEVAA